MAFKPKKKSRERVELVSLIDMIFLLLVFFLVTSYVIRMPLQERGMYIPTPKYDIGRAQIVIQFVDEGRVFWLDEDASSVVSDFEQNYGYVSDSRLTEMILDALISQNIISLEDLDLKLQALRQKADSNPNGRFFVLIRCPDEIPFHRIVSVIARLTDSTYRNIRYGCLGGTLEQIRSCRRIYTVFEDDSRGIRRKNIRIDF